MMEVQLKTILSKPMSKAGLLEFIRTQEPDISALISISLEKDYELAFRASWMLEHALENSPDLFKVNARQLIETYCNLKNFSCLRSYSKILRELHIDLLTNSAINLDRVIEKSFECVIDPLCPVAVKANCLDVLFKLRSQNSWLPEELKAQLQYLLGSESPALLSRSKFLLSKLNKSPGF